MQINNQRKSAKSARNIFAMKQLTIKHFY